jgi:eukaryotic-like serine/threonine-protein kinase
MRADITSVSGLSRQQIERVDALLDELLEVPEAHRLTTLQDRHIDDPSVAAEVESLLRAMQLSGNFLRDLPRPQFDPEVQDPIIGSRIGVWRITRLIGRGGMGEVYEAQRADGAFEQRVAISCSASTRSGKSSLVWTMPALRASMTAG